MDDEFDFEPYFKFLGEQAKMMVATSMVARLQRSLYESLLEVGFDEDQAMRLVEKTTGFVVHEGATLIRSILDKGDSE